MDSNIKTTPLSLDQTDKHDREVSELLEENGEKISDYVKVVSTNVSDKTENGEYQPDSMMDYLNGMYD